MSIVTSRRARALLSAVLLALALRRPAQAHGSAAPSTWRDDLPCGRLLAAPRPRARSGCSAAACVDLREDGVVCSCKDPSSGDLRLVVERGGGAAASWPIEPMLGEPTAFRVTRADLDGDGRDEWLVAVLDVVSNGMAVQSWTTCVLDGRDPSRPRACVATDDVPFLSMPTRGGQGKAAAHACRLLAARWRWGREPRRGDGLYLVGRWLAYRDGALSDDPGRLVIARRYLYRFAAQRADAIENVRAAPIAWWKDPTVRVLRCPMDPLCRESEEEEQP